MSPRPLALRRARPAVAGAVLEVKRLRQQLAEITAHRDQLAGMLTGLIAAGDHDSELTYRRILCAETAAHVWPVAWRAGYEQCSRQRNREFQAWVADCHILSGTPLYSQLEARRWGPAGREHFGDPRPGDFPGTEVAR